MAADQDPAAELAALHPDPRLLGTDLAALPESLGRPDPIPPSRTGRRIVAAGAALTGTTLILGSLLLILGAALLIAGSIGGGIVSALVGALLVGTHWGWVHVAELSRQRLEERAHREIVERRDAWLAGIAPHAHTTVTTRAAPDGALEIVTVRHDPLRASSTTFTFTRREVAVERHGPDEPAAIVVERAELLRRQAAEITERARARYAALAGERQLEGLRELDAGEQRAADRAAAEALSAQINANLRTPPLE